MGWIFSDHLHGSYSALTIPGTPNLGRKSTRPSSQVGGRLIVSLLGLMDLFPCHRMMSRKALTDVSPFKPTLKTGATVPYPPSPPTLREDTVQYLPSLPDHPQNQTHLLHQRHVLSAMFRPLYCPPRSQQKLDKRPPILAQRTAIPYALGAPPYRPLHGEPRKDLQRPSTKVTVPKEDLFLTLKPIPKPKTQLNPTRPAPQPHRAPRPPKPPRHLQPTLTLSPSKD
jgi:hypothetical protein